MRIRKNKDDGDTGGDLTPMIDMTFQLIAFFMVLINFAKNEQHQDIQLPDSVLAKPPEEQMTDTITLHLKKDATVVLHGMPPVSLEGLNPLLARETDSLRGQKKSVAQATIIIRGHKDVAAGKVQELIQLCQEHRFEKFALRKRRPQGKTMKFRHNSQTGDDKIELQMTPMIDIVFQLLVFFIMTFNIVAMEGDFNIKMPMASVQQTKTLEDPPDQLTLIVHLSAGAEGNLAGITLNNDPIAGTTTKEIFKTLNDRVIEATASNEPGEGQEGEVELGFDYDLRYEYVIGAITAVTGYIDPNTGKPVKLIEKIKFAAPQQ